MKTDSLLLMTQILNLERITCIFFKKIWKTGPWSGPAPPVRQPFTRSLHNAVL